MDVGLYFLHLSLSSVILIYSSTESPVHILMLSTQAVRMAFACVHLALFLALSLSPGNSLYLFPHGVTIVC